VSEYIGTQQQTYHRQAYHRPVWNLCQTFLPNKNMKSSKVLKFE
jgi:hypothetical protein